VEEVGQQQVCPFLAAAATIYHDAIHMTAAGRSEALAGYEGMHGGGGGRRRAMVACHRHPHLKLPSQVIPPMWLSGNKGRMLVQFCLSLDVDAHSSTWHLQILPTMKVS